MSATTCSVMLIFAIPMMFLYENLVAHICPISAVDGLPVHNACFSYNILVLFLTGILVNGPYALITTAVSAELGKEWRSVLHPPPTHLLQSFLMSAFLSGDYRYYFPTSSAQYCRNIMLLYAQAPTGMR